MKALAKAIDERGLKMIRSEMISHNIWQEIREDKYENIDFFIKQFYPDGQ